MELTGMKLGIVGSREFDDYELLCKNVDVIRYAYPDITHIVSGGARGADLLAEYYADENNLIKLIYRADWERFGKSAGFRRNQDIWKESDIIIAFWDGKSKGTKHTIDKYKGLLYIIEYNKFLMDEW